MFCDFICCCSVLFVDACFIVGCCVCGGLFVCLLCLAGLLAEYRVLLPSHFFQRFPPHPRRCYIYIYIYIYTCYFICVFLLLLLGVVVSVLFLCVLLVCLFWFVILCFV